MTQLDRNLDTDAGAELCVSLMFVHPACAAEAAFLFGIKPHGRGTKRKKGRQPVQVGELEFAEACSSACTDAARVLVGNLLDKSLNFMPTSAVPNLAFQ